MSDLKLKIFTKLMAQKHNNMFQINFKVDILLYYTILLSIANNTIIVCIILIVGHYNYSYKI